MANDMLLSGNRFNLYRMVTGQAVFVCLAANLGLTETKEMEETTRQECDDPTAIPSRQSVVKSLAWSLNFGGKASMAQYKLLRDDYKSETPVAYRIVAVPGDGIGAGQWDGDIHIESLEMSKSDNGIVSLSAQARGDGDLSFLQNS